MSQRVGKSWVVLGMSQRVGKQLFVPKCHVWVCHKEGRGRAGQDVARRDGPERSGVGMMMFRAVPSLRADAGRNVSNSLSGPVWCGRCCTVE